MVFALSILTAVSGVNSSHGKSNSAYKAHRSMTAFPQAKAAGVSRSSHRAQNLRESQKLGGKLSQDSVKEISMTPEQLFQFMDRLDGAPRAEGNLLDVSWRQGPQR